MPELGSQVTAIALEAGSFLKNRFGTPGEISRKPDAAGDGHRLFDVVTEVDHAVEALIIERIHELSPSAWILTEERGIVAPADEAVHVNDKELVVSGVLSTTDNRAAAQDSWMVPGLADTSELWIVDPLDGTVNFAHSVPGFCTSIAVYRNGTPTAGCIYDPMVDEMFSFITEDDAVGGEPVHRAFCNGRPLTIPANQNPNDCILAAGSLSGIKRAGIGQFQAWRRLGSAALSLAYVASGRYGAYVQHGLLAPWDVAVGVPLVLAAGGTVSTPAGATWSFPLESWAGCVAAGSDLHPLVMDMLLTGE